MTEERGRERELDSILDDSIAYFRWSDCARADDIDGFYVRHTIFEKTTFIAGRAFIPRCSCLLRAIGALFCVKTYERGSFYEREILERDWFINLKP